VNRWPRLHAGYPARVRGGAWARPKSGSPRTGRTARGAGARGLPGPTHHWRGCRLSRQAQSPAAPPAPRGPGDYPGGRRLSCQAQIRAPWANRSLAPPSVVQPCTISRRASRASRAKRSPRGRRLSSHAQSRAAALAPLAPRAPRAPRGPPGQPILTRPSVLPPATISRSRPARHAFPGQPITPAAVGCPDRYSFAPRGPTDPSRRRRLYRQAQSRAAPPVPPAPPAISAAVVSAPARPPSRWPRPPRSPRAGASRMAPCGPRRWRRLR
jgi:hypothetical protein